MAEQNILAGDMSVLAQVRSDIKEYGINSDKLTSLSQEVASMKKNIEATEKALNDEKEAMLKKRREDVVAGFDNAIAIDRSKIKEVQAERDKAKEKGIKERIAAETASLRKDNVHLNAQIDEVLQQNHIPKFCKSRVYVALFMTKGIRNILFCVLLFVVLFLVIPEVVCFLFPQLTGYQLLLLDFIFMFVLTVVYKLMNDFLLLPNVEVMQDVNRTKQDIVVNRKKIRKIQKSIKKDTSEEMYGLEEFDSKISTFMEDIEKIEGEKSLALQEFESKTRPDIVAEIDKRDRARIEALRKDVMQKSEEIVKLQELVKKQKIYISSNYEAYLGSEYAVLEKLDELMEIMKTTNTKTIGQAMLVNAGRK